MSLAAVMAKELDSVSKRTEETVAQLESEVPANKRREFDNERDGTLSALRKNREMLSALQAGEASLAKAKEAPPLLNYANRMAQPLYPRLSKAGRQRLLSLRNEFERYDRKRQLLRPSRANLIPTLWWMSQQGRSKDLDSLFRLKTVDQVWSEDARRGLTIAKQAIIQREINDLLRFFEFSPAECARTIDATIAKSQTVVSPYLKKAFKVERPTQVIRRMREMKELLEERFDEPRIQRWLNTPLEPFDGKTPREALLKGQTLPVLHLLKRFPEGPHY